MLILTTGMVPRGTIWRVGIIYIVKRPMSLICLPLHDSQYRETKLPFPDPSGIGLPIRASLYPPDLFSKKSFCLFEQLMGLDFGHPERCIFLKKSGASLRGGSWFCEYDGEFKTCLTPVNLTNPYERNSSTPAGPTAGRCRGGRSSPLGSHRPSVVVLGDLSPKSENSEDFDSEVSAEEERPDNLNFWFRVDEDWAFRSRMRNPLLEHVERDRLPPQGISVLEGMVADVVDEAKYYVAANSLTSILTVRWKHAERAQHWGKFTKAKTTIDGLGCKKFHSSSSSSLSLHTYAECVIRAKRWVTWHSTWVYDTRPIFCSPKTRFIAWYSLTTTLIWVKVRIPRT